MADLDFSSLDESYRQLVRELEKTDPGLAKRLEAAWAELQAHLKSLANPEVETSVRLDIYARIEKCIKALLDAMRRYRAAQRLISTLGRTGKAFGQVIGKGFKLITSPVVLQGQIIAEIVLYTPGPGEVGSIAIPLDCYECIDSLLLTFGDPEGGMRCFYACVYRLIGHQTVGGDLSKPYVYGGDKDAEEVVTLHEYNCQRPPSAEIRKSICQKYIYAQAEL
jgi:hypothetical protein